MRVFTRFSQLAFQWFGVGMFFVSILSLRPQFGTAAAQPVVLTEILRNPPIGIELLLNNSVREWLSSMCPMSPKSPVSGFEVGQRLR